MAYLKGNLVQLVYPGNGATNIKIDSFIKIQFSKDMNLSTVTERTIKLFDSNLNPVACSLTMDPENPTKLAVLTPNSFLSPSTRYLVVITGGENGVRSIEINGEADFIFADRSWNFTTSSVMVLDKATLLTPTDHSLIQDRIIQFSWQSILGSSKYQFQIAKDSSFSSVVVDNNSINGTNYLSTSDDNLNLLQNYYWRVRALDNEGRPGIWSLVNQFYIEDSLREPDTYSESYIEITKSSIANNKAEVDVSIESIDITFSSKIDEESVEDNIKITARDIDGGILSKKIEGQVAVSGNKLTFVFSEPLENSMEYKVIIGDGLSNVDGSIIGEDTVYRFITVPNPYYSSIEIIRDDLGLFIKDIEDLEISKVIYRVSKWANQISNQPYGSQNSSFMGSSQRQTTNSIFFHEYVRYESGLRLLVRKSLEHSISKGEIISLGDFSKQATGSLVPDINVAMKRIEQYRDEAKKKLEAGEGTITLPTFAVLGSSGDPYPSDGRSF